MIQSPFIPFIIIFCHIIETSKAADLERMRSLVETLESTSDVHAHNICERQIRLFKALYEVADKYIDVKSRADGGGQGEMSWSIAQQHADALGGPTSSGLGIGTSHAGEMARVSGTTTTTDVPTGHMSSHAEPDGGDAMGPVDGLVSPAALQNTAFGDVDMEMDLSGAQLWDWFNKNQSMMRILEDA